MRYIHTEDVHNTTAAEIVVPLVMESFSPSSVLDVGCGIGTWLSVFKKYGVASVLGIDGGYVDPELLQKFIAKDEFLPVDLVNPFNLGRRYDFIVSLEVAEHLPQASADIFVKSLTLHGDLILFSAAAPYQGGQNHLNEQWQTYWIEKFAVRGFRAYDWLRPSVWSDGRVDLWYRQNTILFSSRAIEIPKSFIPNLILPDLWEKTNHSLKNSQEQLIRIRDGKVGIGFYLKGIVKSLRYLGKKVS
ncbi:MAG: class I SAM-dependent methyltransferase [Cyclobacteriaceae bacterium]